ncbi:hypothetical protein DP42_4631 [Burkholderia pseudomallei]|nr:hypothetical protein DO73_2568 [Burkholderia pseudomallei]KGD21951.1 hypothetical protein DP42_4631 [Burkholderia pseudomallei]
MSDWPAEFDAFHDSVVDGWAEFLARSERGRNEMEGVKGRLTAGDH